MIIASSIRKLIKTLKKSIRMIIDNLSSDTKKASYIQKKVNYIIRNLALDIKNKAPEFRH